MALIKYSLELIEVVVLSNLSADKSAALLFVIKICGKKFDTNFMLLYSVLYW